MGKLKRLPDVAALNAPLLIADMWKCQQLLESVILTVPTSETRNKLCDANIHLGEAQRLIKEAVKYDPPKV
jgi:hypothetical protein